MGQTIIISNISHIFLFDFSHYSVSIFSTATQLLSFDSFIILKEIIITGSAKLFLIFIHKVQTYNLTKWPELP